MLNMYLSLLTFGLSVFGLLLAVNYAVYIWENQKIQKLTKNIKSYDENDILNKSNTERNFSSLDMQENLNKNTSLKVSKFGNKNKSNFLTLLKQGNYLRFVKSLYKFAQVKSVSIFGKLKTLLKTFDKDQEPDIFQDKKFNFKQKEIDETVAKLTKEEVMYTEDKKIDLNWPISEILEEEDPEIKLLTTEIFSTSKTTTTTKTKVATGATIGLLGEDEEVEENKEATLFEQMETRILHKLKDGGLNNYDVWLDLAGLYEKYQQREKAIEVYSLVLKHSHDREKEYARDKLIELS